MLFRYKNRQDEATLRPYVKYLQQFPASEPNIIEKLAGLVKEAQTAGIERRYGTDVMICYVLWLLKKDYLTDSFLQPHMVSIASRFGYELEAQKAYIVDYILGLIRDGILSSREERDGQYFMDILAQLTSEVVV